MDLKDLVNRYVDISVVLGYLVERMCKLQEEGRLNVVEFVKELDGKDEYTAIKHCISALGMVKGADEELNRRYKLLYNYSMSYQRPLSTKVQNFYDRLQVNLKRY